MNKFEQVSSFDHQMSLAGGQGQVVPVKVAGPGPESPCTEESQGRGSLYGEVQCILGNGHMGCPCG